MKILAIPNVVSVLYLENVESIFVLVMDGYEGDLSRELRNLFA